MNRHLSWIVFGMAQDCFGKKLPAGSKAPNVQRIPQDKVLTIGMSAAQETVTTKN